MCKCYTAHSLESQIDKPQTVRISTLGGHFAQLVCAIVDRDAPVALPLEVRFGQPRKGYDGDRFESFLVMDHDAHGNLFGTRTSISLTQSWRNE